MNNRPVSITHLVLGLIFAGVALIWLVDGIADLPSPAISGPALLIGAGVIGLVVSLAGASRRNATRRADPAISHSSLPEDEIGPDESHPEETR